MTKSLFALTLFAASTLLAGQEVAIQLNPEIAVIGHAKKNKKNEAPPAPFYYDQNSTESFMYGEFLYWDLITEDPMNFAQKRNNQNGTTGNFSVDDEDIKSLNYGFTPGFRVGIGRRMGRAKLQNNIRPWQVEADYTRVHPHTSETLHASGDDTSNPNLNQSQFIYPVVPTLNGSTALFAHSRATFGYDRANLKFAWPMWITETVILRLMLGGSFAWFSNNWKNTFRNQQDSDLLQKANFKWKWLGGGILGGGDIYMGVGSGFGFFANTSFGLLFGPMKQREYYKAQNNNGTDNSRKLKYHFNSFQPTVDVGIGIDYKHWFKRDVMLQLALGWEFSWWFDMNQFGRQGGNSNAKSLEASNKGNFFDNNPSDLGFNGLTAKIALEF